MQSKSSALRRSAHLLSIFIFFCSAAISLSAQTPATIPTPTPDATRRAKPATEEHFLANILKDQKTIWGSPFHFKRGDAKFIAPLGLSAAAFIATDRRTAGRIDSDGSLPPLSRAFSQIGSLYGTASAAAAFYFIGRTKHDLRARETGVLGAEALIDSALVVAVLKQISQRPRPLVDHASGEFFDGGHSFPSGHAVGAWSFATVLACEYGDRHRLVPLAAYGIATAVSLSRFSGQRHFLSDVLVGSAIGYGIGRMVYRRHHDPALEEFTTTGRSNRGCRIF